MKHLYGIDFFSGVGGVTSGFRAAGINVLMGMDNDLSAKISYEQSNPGSKFILNDIQNTQTVLHTIRQELSQLHTPGNFVFCACAPCQPFSTQNKNYAQDDRRSLLLSFFDVVFELEEELKPGFIFAENVGPMKIRGAEILDTAIKKLSETDYEILEPKVINASDFGVPQNRKRLIFLAVNRKKVDFDRAKLNWNYFYNKYSETGLTVRDAIGHLPEISAGETHPDDYLHYSRNITPLNMTRLRMIKQPGGGRENWDESLMLKCHRDHKGHKDVYGRMWWDRPAPTLTTKCINITNGRFAHPEQHRGISLREAAILQTMDDFIFQKDISKEKIARFIGNAVPPKLAEKFGKFIQELSNPDGD